MVGQKKFSAARLVQIIVNFLWIMALVISGLLFIGFFFIAFFRPDYNPGGWSIMLDPDSLRHSIKSIVPELGKIAIEPSQIEMEFESPTTFGTIFFQFSRVVIAVSVLLSLLFHIRKIAYTWPNNNPFSQLNIERLKKIAYLLILIPFLLTLDLLSTHYFLIAKFDFPVDPGFFIDWNIGMVGNLLNRFQWEYLIFGFGILALAQVFRTGLEYQEDSTSII